MSVKKVATLAEFQELLKTNERVAVDFTATWCRPCKFIGPKFEGLAQTFKTIIFVKVDVDENSETSGEYGISAMPTFKFFKNGKEVVSALLGANEKDLQTKLADLASH